MAGGENPSRSESRREREKTKMLKKLTQAGKPVFLFVRNFDRIR